MDEEIEQSLVCCQENGEPAFTEAEYPAIVAEWERRDRVTLDAEALRSFLAQYRGEVRDHQSSR